MNVWVKKTRKRVKCFYCSMMIETGEWQVVCQYFMPLKHSDVTWTKVMHFHAKEPNCWLDRAIAELETRPVYEMRGRRPDAISDGMREERRKVLRRRASVVQRISVEMAGGGRMDKVSHLADMLEKLAETIETLGGVPKSWK